MRNKKAFTRFLPPEAERVHACALRVGYGLKSMWPRVRVKFALEFRMKRLLLSVFGSCCQCACSCCCCSCCNSCCCQSCSNGKKHTMTKYDDSEDEEEASPTSMELETKARMATASISEEQEESSNHPIEDSDRQNQDHNRSSILPSVNELQHELNQAIQISIENSPLTWCFRAAAGGLGGGGSSRTHGPTHPVPTVLRKRGLLAKASWRRAMRAGGPFAPGSIVGAVAADTHRRRGQGASSSHSAHSPSSPNQSPTTPTLNPFASVGPSCLPLSTISRTSMVTAVGQSALLEDDASSFHSFHSAVDTVASALSDDARKAFNEAGVHPQGLHPQGGTSSSGGHHHHHHHHHHIAHKISLSPLRPLQQHAAAAYAHAVKAKDRAIKFVKDMSQRRTSELEDSRPNAKEDIQSFLSHSTHPAVDAFRSGLLGFGFSGGGFLFPWHLGVVTELQDAGIITTKTPLSGASCGAIIVSCVHSRLNLHSLVKELMSFAEDCRTNGTAGRLRFVIEHFMTANLSSDAHLKCGGKTHIQMTRVFPYLKVISVSEWTSKEDLVQAICCSCHIPAYNDGSLVFRYRGSLFIDGGALRHLPVPPKV